jgi:hypothetical protein
MKLLITIYISISSLFATAQDFAIDAFGGVGLSYINNSSYNQFTESYERYTQPTNTFNAKSNTKPSFKLGLVSYFGNISFEMGYTNHLGFNQHFDFAEGTRKFNMSYSSLKTVTSIVLSGNDESRPVMTAGLIIGMGGMRMRSYFQYPDGTKSMGSEKDLNGIFDQYTTEFGLELKYNLWLSNQAALYAKASMSLMRHVTDMEFHSYLRSISMSLPLEYLPTDYEEYMNNGSVAYNYDGEYVSPNAFKLEVELGLSYRLFNN